MSIDTENGFRVSTIFRLFIKILGPEKDFYTLAMIYGVGISLLSLATPISVQMLINTVANTALATPLIVLSSTLFGLLVASGLLYALRVHLMEIFGRRFYARCVSDIALRAIYARDPFFHDDGRSPLFNRYFDILVVQKVMPALLIGGFTLLLQAGVGFIVVSFYHPLFLAFNAIIIAMLWSVWLIWGKAAIRTAIERSHRKHIAAAWLEGVASSNGFFKTDQQIDYALHRTDMVTKGYVDAHRDHFRQAFAQTISFLMIYAMASAALLGLGGWLVIQGQLSLGQLVAAELILTAVFFGISQLGTYMDHFYDLCAAVEELSRFFDVELEDDVGNKVFAFEDSTLHFVNVRGEARGAPAILNFRVESAATVMAAVEHHGLQRLITNLLKRHVEPYGGFIALGGADILSMKTTELHRQIAVLDRPTIIEMSIREYLELNCEDFTPAKALDAIRLVGLEQVIARFEDGLDTQLAGNGRPLSTTETMQLKLAAAILARPRVLILNPLYDLVDEAVLSRTLAHLRADKNNTVLYFSRRKRDLGCDTFLYIRENHQDIFYSYETFYEAVYGASPAALPSQNRMISGESSVAIGGEY